MRAPSVHSSPCRQTPGDTRQHRRHLSGIAEDTGEIARVRSHRLRSLHHAPLRYYLWLPLLRIADMWLRPRTETLPADTRWWEFNDEPKWSALAISIGLIGIFYTGTAMWSLLHRRVASHVNMLLLFVLLRTAFLGSLENPEPRYTLECYPVVIVLASAVFLRL